MFDIPSHCEAVEKQLSAAGLHIAVILQKAGVNRSSWTGWKHRNISPRLSTLSRVDAVTQEALANPKAFAKRARATV